MRNRGDAEAQFNLRVAYAAGKGVPQDYVQAYTWIAPAATQGHEKSAEVLSVILKEMSPAQITKGLRLSHEYAEKYVKK